MDKVDWWWKKIELKLVGTEVRERKGQSVKGKWE
jgi:hypothetical protein